MCLSDYLRKNRSIKVACLVVSILPVASYAAETATQTTITVKGTIVGNTCETLNGQTIDFGSLNRTQFQGNLYKKPQENVVMLSNCGSAANRVKVTVLDYGNNQAPSSKAASGVSVELYNGTTLLSKNTKSSEITLTASGTNKKLELIPALRIDPSKFKEGEIASSIAISIDYL